MLPSQLALPCRYTLLALCIASSIASHQALASVEWLGELPEGYPDSIAEGISADGNVVVGYSDSANGHEAFLWSRASGMIGLGYLPGGGWHGDAFATSADGSVVVGNSDSIDGQEAFRWTSSTGMVGLGQLPGGSNSNARAVSADGSVVVGDGYSSNSGIEAFRWTSDAGMTGLGHLTGGTPSSSAKGISADGLVIVGYSDSSNGHEAFRWASGTGMVGLGDLTGGTFNSVALGTSADGSVIVGSGTTDNGTEAFRWTSSTGMVGLGYLSGAVASPRYLLSPNDSLGSLSPVSIPGESLHSSAYATSYDGSVVVGYSDSSRGGEAFRWTSATGMQSLAEWAGVAPTSWILQGANSISADGLTVTGFGYNEDGNAEAFIARAGTFITINDLASSLNSSSQAVRAAQRSGSTLINGAHSRPLSRRVEKGQSTLWLAGDWGTDNHGQHSGDIGMTEIGGGQNFGLAQVNLAVGQTWARQNYIYDSYIEADSTYVLAEGIIPINEVMGLWTTLGGFASWGNNNIRRGYVNGTNQDYSYGDPDTKSYGLRARVDWENAAHLGRLSASPFIDLTYQRNQQESYQEKSGGMPTNYDGYSEHTTDLRMGIQGSLPLFDTGFNLISLVEGVHRFDDQAASVSGEVIGISAFDMPGQSYDQNWMRFSLGFDGRLGGGKGSVMLNRTTEGEMPDNWLAASYQVAF
ncbi:autotransporter domain-containing protein [Atopomonas sediminilitoris]|uniref:autotransporter domain-containing protein n=1 Tax=Atopomonas sediminilitoris TaxID=2919919 RepID=UPI001F4EA643|nr:autotransporter domain-containing protein [Atopomonas sediminilitoris]MCJ8169423.1 autotransporter domain-containing protein [Atopomonas sediminilitoris]